MHINQILYKGGKTDSYIDKNGRQAWENTLQNYMEIANKNSPIWITFRISGEEIKDKKLDPIINERLLAKDILKRHAYHSVSQIQAGAWYSSRLGAWKLFKGKEMKRHIKKQLVKELDPYEIQWSNRRSSTITEFIEASSYDDNGLDNPFDKSDPNLVAFTNGTFNLRTGKLQAANKEDYILSAHDYDLDTSKRETPYTVSWLTDLVGKDNVPFLMAYIGYCFYRSYDYSQIILIIQSEGGHGKSHLLNYIEKCVGFSNTSALSLKQLSGRSEFNTSGLYHKDLNIFADIDATVMTNLEFLKGATGEDTMFIQFKGADGFQIKNHAKMLFSANVLPQLNDLNDTGVLRRFKILPVIAPKINKAFKEKHPTDQIESERPAFVHQCLLEFMRARKEQSGITFGNTPDITKATKAWILSNDSVGSWLDDRESFWKGNFLSGEQLSRNYGEWSRVHNMKVFSKNELLSILTKKKGFKPKRKTIPGHYLRGYLRE